jgi:hypothetical protein
MASPSTIANVPQLLHERRRGAPHAPAQILLGAIGGSF